MATINMTVRIEAAPERVFDVFTDLERAPERIRGIERLEVLTEGPVAAGTRFRETRIMFKKEAEMEMEITAFDPGRSYTVGCVSCGCEYETVFTFEPDGAATTVRMEVGCRPLTRLAKVVAPVMGRITGGTMKKCLAQDLEDLRAAAESTGSL